MNSFCCRETLLASGFGGALVSVLICLPLSAWPGYEYRAWQKITTWTQPELVSEQAGNRELAPLLLDAAGQPIQDLPAWKKKRAATQTMIRAILGKPTSLAVPKVEVQELDAEILADHVRRHIKIRQ